MSADRIDRYTAAVTRCRVAAGALRAAVDIREAIATNAYILEGIPKALAPEDVENGLARAREELALLEAALPLLDFQSTRPGLEPISVRSVELTDVPQPLRALRLSGPAPGRVPPGPGERPGRPPANGRPLRALPRRR